LLTYTHADAVIFSEGKQTIAEPVMSI
jgi:hypothetical protein